MKAITIQRISLAAIIVVMLGIAVWRYFAVPEPVRAYDGRTHHLTLEAAGFSRDAPYGRQVAVRLNGVSGTFYHSEEEAYKPGDLLNAPFRITLTKRSVSHFKAVTYFDVGVIHTAPRLQDRPVIWAQGIKTRITALYKGDNAALLTGILTGDRSGMSDKLVEDLFVSGMTHVAAVSGLHVSILVGFIALVMRSRRRSALISLPLVFLYAAITGFTPSASRAGIMIAVFTIAPLIGREYDSLRAMGAAFLILCVINPYAVFEPAMQLSFSATLGLILFSNKWQCGMQTRFERLPVPKIAVRFVSSSLAASFGALVFSIPFAAYWFGGASLLAPLSNLLLLWLINVIFIGGALSLALPFLAPVMTAVLWIFRAVTGLLGSLPYAVLYTAQPYLFAWLLYAYMMFVILVLSRRWKTPALLSAAALIVCLSLTVWRDSRFSLEITVLDVGQGQSVVIRSGGQTMIYDCGGTANAGRVAARYLQSRGIRRVDHLILSHYDADHINGVPALLAVTDTERIYGPVSEHLPEEYTVETVPDAFSFALGKAEVWVIPSLWFGDDNARGISALISMDGFSFLLTGDLGHASERWLLRRTGLSRADVIVAGHHGSAGSTSEELLDTLNPRAAVISSGIKNTYGHPAPETLARLLERDIYVYRTDRRGNVTIRR